MVDVVKGQDVRFDAVVEDIDAAELEGHTKGDQFVADRQQDLPDIALQWRMSQTAVRTRRAVGSIRAFAPAVEARLPSGASDNDVSR